MAESLLDVLKNQKKKQPAKMDIQFSVFNQHVNNADKRAKKVMADWFPQELKTIEMLEKKHKGIMGIFKIDPENATMIYAALVTAFVNKY